MFRLGIIDFDSSHCHEYAARLNGTAADREQHVEGARVVAAWPGTSTMAPERIARHRPLVEACGVELVGELDDLRGRVDGLLILSLNGTAHLERVRAVAGWGLPVYVDKPFASRFDEAVEIVATARRAGIPLCGGSALRFSEDLLRFAADLPRFGPLHGVLVHGPAKRDPHDPGLLHYGIHSVEVLFALMGPNCRSVSSVSVPDADVVTGRWQDGRLGTLRGVRRGSTAYGFTAFCEGGILSRPVSTRWAYRNLLRELVPFFRTGVPPIPVETTLETIAFAAAALAGEDRHASWTDLPSPPDSGPATPA